MPLVETPSIKKHALFCTAEKTLEKPKTRAIHSPLEMGLELCLFLCRTLGSVPSWESVFW